MGEDEGYKTVFGIQGNLIVELQARRVKDDQDDGWLIKRGCFRDFIGADRLSETREEAEARLKRLNGR